MKVALVGNMNNNHFSLMRYLRDLGVDAHLFLYDNDGKGSLSHFSPENDTYNMSSWEPFIHRTNIHNGGRKAIFQFLFSRSIMRIFAQYDKIIANGILPAHSYLSGRKIDILVPYSVGGEFLNYMGNGKFWNKLVFAICKYFQKLGLRYNCKSIFLADQSDEQVSNYKALGLTPELVAIPMVYLEKGPEDLNVCGQENLKEFFNLSKHRRIIFSHVSHIWSSDHFMSHVKRNDIFIRSFAEYLQKSESRQYTLVLSDYGIDVESSKNLIRTLEIEQYVLWVPKLSRKEILFILEYVELGVSELGGYLWGGVGWEFIAKGVPFFHNLSDSANVFKENQTPPPSFINVKSSEEICEYLLKFESCKDALVDYKKELLSWFKDYQGSSLAKQYLENLLKCE